MAFSFDWYILKFSKLLSGLAQIEAIKKKWFCTKARMPGYSEIVVVRWMYLILMTFESDKKIINGSGFA